MDHVDDPILTWLPLENIDEFMPLPGVRMKLLATSQKEFTRPDWQRKWKDCWINIRISVNVQGSRRRDKKNSVEEP